MAYSLGLTSSLRRRAVEIVSEPARQMAGEGTTLQELEHSVERKNNSYTHEGTAAKHVSEVSRITLFQQFL